MQKRLYALSPSVSPIHSTTHLQINQDIKLTVYPFVLCQLLRGHIRHGIKSQKAADVHWLTSCPRGAQHTLYIFFTSFHNEPGEAYGSGDWGLSNFRMDCQILHLIVQSRKKKKKKKLLQTTLLKLTYLIARGLSQVSIYSLFYFYFTHTYNSLIICFINQLSGQNLCKW